MAKKIRGVKLKSDDINKNTGRDISHTISKIQANEKKYTIILVLVFMAIFFTISFFVFRVSPDNLYNFSSNVSNLSFYSSGEVVSLFEDKIMNDKDGLNLSPVILNIYNNTLDDANYKISFVEDLNMRKKCGCDGKNSDLSQIKFTVDSDNIKSFQNNDMVISTGFIKAGEHKKVSIRIWLSNESGMGNHIHGYFDVERINY